ncbi:response regulator transcription factor [Mycoplasmatota bacterium zrk1]
MKKILLVEDDSSLAYGLSFALKSNGFMVEVANNIKDALVSSKSNRFDLVILDVMLPDGTGFELFNEITKDYDVPTIFLSALSDELNIVTGLNIGGDDYITKPFNVSELISRINSVLRRSNKIEESTYQSNCILLNINQMKLFKNGLEIVLSVTEFKIIKYLMEQSKSIVTRQRLLEKVWDIDSKFVDDNTLAVNIRRIREKIEDESSTPKYIQTIRGVGYIWNQRCDRR